MNRSAIHKTTLQRYLLPIVALMFVFVAVLCFSVAQGQEAENKTDHDPTAQPIDIVSDKMEAHQDSSKVEFSGNVIATQGNMEIRADSIKIFLDSSQIQSPPQGSETSQNTKIRQIVCSGHVQCRTGQRQAFSDTAVYTASDKIIVMTGSQVKLVEGENEITGEKLTLFLDQNRAVVESNTEGGVRASFTPSKMPVSVGGS